MAWNLVNQIVADGRKFTTENDVTGTMSSEGDLIAKASRYVSERLLDETFQKFISIFESFFFDFLRLWLRAYPRSMMGRKVDFKTILDAADKDAITALVIDKEVNELLYERPVAWFEYLEEKAKLGCPKPDEIDRFAEAKASRDVLVHTSGVGGKSYEAKAGKLARFKVGERLEISLPYHRETWVLLRKMIVDVSDAAVTKFGIKLEA